MLPELPTFLTVNFSHASLQGFLAWDINSVTTELRNAFKTTLHNGVWPGTKSAAYKIFRNDLRKALSLFDQHSDSRGKTPFEIKVRYMSNDGQTICLLSRGVITAWDEFGEPLGMKGCFVDITGFAAKKEMLRRENIRNTIFFDGINAGVWDWNLVTGEQWWSEKMFRMTGYRYKEFAPDKTQFLHNLVNPADREKVQEVLALHISGAAPFIVYVRIRHKDGQYFWYEAAGKAVFDKKGRPVRMVGSLIWRHEKKLLEMELLKNQFLLNETANMLKIGGWEYTIDDKSLYWSRQVFDIHELDYGQQPDLEQAVAFYHGASGRKITAAFAALVQEGKPYDLELEICTAKGRKIWVRSMGKPIFAADGRLTGAQGTLQDISDQKRKQTELEQSHNIIAEQNNQLNNFAYIVSHNLRTHAGNIASLLEMSEHVSTDAERQQLFAYLKKTAGSLNATINKLNDVVHADNLQHLLRTELSFEKTLEHVLQVLAPAIEETGAQIKHSFLECPLVEYVPAYLESILFNLLSNAIKYRDPLRSPYIFVQSYKAHDAVMLMVKDNGLGIDLQKHQHRLFAKNCTFHGHPDARGIGLFITRNQVESMGGTISVESAPGTGTVFTVQLMKQA